MRKLLGQEYKYFDMTSRRFSIVLALSYIIGLCAVEINEKA